MVEFAKSEHHYAQARYEKALGEAKASDQEARAAKRKSIEDELVEEGMEGVEKYITLLDKRWERASCLAEYDGLRMGYGIARRAKERILALQSAQTETDQNLDQ